MFWNKNITSLEYWFIATFVVIYLVYFAKIIYLSSKLKISARASFIKFLPRIILFSLLVITLLEPTFGNLDNFSNSNTTNKIVYFIVDISKSMNAEDIAPSRLEKAKNEIKKIAGYFPGDRFGIIAFSSEAHLHTALTSDTEIFKEMASTLSTEYISATGTNLEAAFKLFIDKINTIPTLNQTSASAILISDGEDFSDLNEQTLNEFKRKRVNLFVIGIGTKKGSNIKDFSGKILKNDNNKVINSKLEADYLKSIAAKTNGKYYEINGFNNPLNEIVKEIEQLKGNFYSQSLNAAKAGNKFHYPLILAIFLICLDILFTIQIFSFKKELR